MQSDLFIKLIYICLIIIQKLFLLVYDHILQKFHYSPCNLLIINLLKSYAQLVILIYYLRVVFVKFSLHTL